MPKQIFLTLEQNSKAHIDLQVNILKLTHNPLLFLSLVFQKFLVFLPLNV